MKVVVEFEIEKDNEEDIETIGYIIKGGLHELYDLNFFGVLCDENEVDESESFRNGNFDIRIEK